MIMVKVYNDKKEAMAFSRLVYSSGLKAEVIKLTHPKGQYLLYISNGINT